MTAKKKPTDNIAQPGGIKRGIGIFLPQQGHIIVALSPSHQTLIPAKLVISAPQLGQYCFSKPSINSFIILLTLFAIIYSPAGTVPTATLFEFFYNEGGVMPAEP